MLLRLSHCRVHQPYLLGRAVPELRKMRSLDSLGGGTHIQGIKTAITRELELIDSGKCSVGQQPDMAEAVLRKAGQALECSRLRGGSRCCVPHICQDGGGKNVAKIRQAHLTQSQESKDTRPAPSSQELLLVCEIIFRQIPDQSV